MKEQKSGRIINISSDYWRGVSMNLTYSAAKAGVVGLTRSAALDMKPFGVTVNAVCPFARTRWYDNLPMEKVESLYKAGLMEKWMHDELHSPGGPEHIPPIVMYLASEKAAHITGRIFGASKGRVAIFSEPIQERGIYKDGGWTLEELFELIPRALYPED
jgi:NAD(P)-dependent dehydrogenase (short-subunit alcohol dehydrogenase family)